MYNAGWSSVLESDCRCSSSCNTRANRARWSCRCWSCRCVCCRSSRRCKRLCNASKCWKFPGGLDNSFGASACGCACNRVLFTKKTNRFKKRDNNDNPEKQVVAWHRGWDQVSTTGRERKSRWKWKEPNARGPVDETRWKEGTVSILAAGHRWLWHLLWWWRGCQWLDTWRLSAAIGLCAVDCRTAPQCGSQRRLMQNACRVGSGCVHVATCWQIPAVAVYRGSQRYCHRTSATLPPLRWRGCALRGRGGGRLVTAR